MRNTIIYILISFIYINAFSQTKNDLECEKKEKFEAVNNYLSSVIKDKNKEIIIVKKKTNVSEILRLFKGNIIKDNLGHFVERDGGAPEPLYNEKDFEIMKKKYQDQTSTYKRENFTNTLWDPEDFTYNKIIFENWEDVYLKMQKVLYPREPVIQIFALSEPIYYKSKQYLVIQISIGDTNSSGFPSRLIAIMKKIKGKWIIVNETRDYIMN